MAATTQLRGPLVAPRFRPDPRRIETNNPPNLALLFAPPVALPPGKASFELPRRLPRPRIEHWSQNSLALFNTLPVGARSFDLPVRQRRLALESTPQSMLALRSGPVFPPVIQSTALPRVAVYPLSLRSWTWSPYISVPVAVTSTRASTLDAALFRRGASVITVVDAVVRQPLLVSAARIMYVRDNRD